MSREGLRWLRTREDRMLHFVIVALVGATAGTVVYRCQVTLGFRSSVPLITSAQ